MANRQFHFSFCVGIALAIAGVFILGKAAVGLSLIALGAAIATLAVLSRATQRKAETSLAPAPVTQHLSGSAADY